ncbi:CKLF-like MARVEL transmembrane domain-containing protein 4 [Ostrinia nubilalis]|uniref:CKLF-like MARVEL transmembrane domain-containing protein 4 n=1 Tax=Ostrinia furnacalis TaxID=93504 RepID=UPI00103F67E5|nr:CKLF-like MARVEL transmembrane domain-containing protein 4 [Ostrinia furnacalis]
MMAPETVVTVDHNKPNAPPQQQQQQQGNALEWLKFNIDYFKTPPGLLKVVELILGILCMALASPWYSTWFVFVAVTCFITTLMWSFVYLLSIREALKIPINWVLSELIGTAIQAVLYLIAFIVLFAATAHTYSSFYGANVAAAVFGIFNTAAYAASAFILFKEHKSTVGVAA